MIDGRMLRAAMAQSAEDMGCRAEDFTAHENRVVHLRMGEHARKYLQEPIPANFISYGNNVVAAITEDLRELAAEYIGRCEWYHLFETPNMHWLGDRLAPMGYTVRFMAQYYLPAENAAPPVACALETRVLEQPDFANLYLPQWSNALCESRKQLDVLGVGAYDNGTLVGLAACSADCDTMWQIGVDVLPGYRGRGVASALTGRLAREIMARGRVPFYCAAWSNIPSARNAIRSGFVPAWVEMTVKPREDVDELNR